MRTIIENLQAGVPTVYGLTGSRLEILRCTYPVSVSIQDENGIEITNGRADQVDSGTYFQPARGFKRFVITSAQAQEIVVGVSNGDSGTRSVAGTVKVDGTVGISGTVDVIDSNKSRVIGGNSFAGVVAMGGVAGQFITFQLVNPVGSGKRIILEKVHLSCQVASSIGVRVYDVGAANANVLATVVNDVVSKHVGGAAVNGALLRRGSTVALVGKAVCYTALNAGGNKTFDLEKPIVLLPGQIAAAVNHTAGNSMDVTLEWDEETI